MYMYACIEVSSIIVPLPLTALCKIVFCIAKLDLAVTEWGQMCSLFIVLKSPALTMGTTLN